MVRKYLRSAYERRIVQRHGEVRLQESRIAGDAALAGNNLPSGIESDSLSFRSLGGSPVSAGLPHFRACRCPGHAGPCDETTRNGPGGSARDGGPGPAPGAGGAARPCHVMANAMSRSDICAPMTFTGGPAEHRGVAGILPLR